ncbi:hypothetical protein ElyMa_006514000 [Elysia marginata]|uniref:Uncharacterized protein n=1 Tax=Elysia marginata TaxID=1093978 RepID=A0AAV4I924_9GAST|nr:hypothetical protein ElyMa_006514000 [Elysia marginata]
MRYNCCSSVSSEVSSCDVGDACLDQGQATENATSASVDGVVYCCSSGNSITISVTRNNRRGYQSSQSTSFISSESYSGVFYSSDLSLSGANNNSSSSNSNNSSTREVVCECWEVDLDDVTDYYNDAKQRFYNMFDDIWNRVSGVFI